MRTEWMLACPALPGESLRGHHAPSRHRFLLSLDPPTIPGGAFLARFLPEEFSLVNRGVVALPPALCAACP
jgi:hypothetical protein